MVVGLAPRSISSRHYWAYQKLKPIIEKALISKSFIIVHGLESKFLLEFESCASSHSGARLQLHNLRQHPFNKGQLADDITI